VTQLQGGLGVVDMCRLAGVSRAGFYRYLQPQAPAEEEMLVRDAIQKIAIEHRRRYGRPRITAQLRAQGMLVNHKRVGRIMREDNLLAVRGRAWVSTTQSQHAYPVYLNLAARLEVHGPDQLWVADLTYIRLRNEFLYLAVVLDRFSRRVVGWELARHLNTELTLAALEMAIAARHPAPGLVHHSDRGWQYACEQYRQRLDSVGILPSMSRPGNPYDNAFCESFMKTLKQEEIYCNQYADLEDLRMHVDQFIDEYYNHRRLHSALGYLSPSSFETRNVSPSPTGMGATLQYFAPPQPSPAGTEERNAS
jgi:putative transposase